MWIGCLPTGPTACRVGACQSAARDASKRPTGCPPVAPQSEDTATASGGNSPRVPMCGSVASDVNVAARKAEPWISLLQAAQQGDVNVAEVRATYGRGPHGPSRPALYIESLFGRTEEGPFTAEQLPAEFVHRGALVDQCKDLERKRSKPPKWPVAFLPPRRENTMYRAAADFSLRRPDIRKYGAV